jgi:IS66 Orf2 like protein/Transposase C of IS166 homeodomain
VLRRDRLSGHLFCFRGRRGNLLKVIWHDGQGACLFTKRLRNLLAASAGNVAADVGGMTVLTSSEPAKHRRPESLSSDLAAAHAMILAEGAARLEAEAKLADARAEAANTQADLSSTEALITYYKLEIEKLHRQLCGTRSEHKARLLEQMELQLEELEATEDGLGAKKAAARR